MLRELEDLLREAGWEPEREEAPPSSCKSSWEHSDPRRAEIWARLHEDASARAPLRGDAIALGNAQSTCGSAVDSYHSYLEGLSVIAQRTPHLSQPVTHSTHKLLRDYAQHTGRGLRLGRSRVGVFSCNNRSPGGRFSGTFGQAARRFLVGPPSCGSRYRNCFSPGPSPWRKR